MEKIINKLASIVFSLNAMDEIEHHNQKYCYCQHCGEMLVHSFREKKEICPVCHAKKYQLELEVTSIIEKSHLGSLNMQDLNKELCLHFDNDYVPAWVENIIFRFTQGII